MKRAKFMIALAIALAVLGGFTEPAAAAVDIYVSINGQLKQCLATTTCPLSNSDVPSGAGFTMSGTVTADDQPGSDTISLSSLDVMASSNNVSGTIIFWASFAGGPYADPNANPPTSVRFQHTAGGTLLNGTGTQASLNSSVTLTGYANDTAIGGSYAKTVSCSPASCGTFIISPNLQGYWFTLSDPRVVKGELDFTLKTAGHHLKLTTSQQVWDGQGGLAATKPGEREKLRQKSGVTIKRTPKTNCDLNLDPEGTCPLDFLEKE